MGDGKENLKERLEKELEMRKREIDNYNRWCKRFKVLMIFGVLLAFSVVTILAFANRCLLVLQYWDLRVFFFTVCMCFIMNVKLYRLKLRKTVCFKIMV